MPAKKIRLVDDLDLKTETTNDSVNNVANTVSQGDIEEIKKVLHAIDWKLWEMYQIAKKFKDYFEIK